jgi:hypothetical protein
MKTDAVREIVREDTAADSRADDDDVEIISRSDIL